MGIGIFVVFWGFLSNNVLYEGHHGWLYTTRLRRCLADAMTAFSSLPLENYEKQGCGEEVSNTNHRNPGRKVEADVSFDFKNRI